MTWSPVQAAALASVFDALNQSGIPWLVLRNYQGLPEANRAKDIDLGVADSDATRVASIIADALRSHGFDRASTTQYFSARCTTFFRATEDEVSSIKIDLVDGIPFRGARLVNLMELHAKCAAYGTFSVPNVADDGVMLWMKPLMMGAGIKSGYVEEILRASTVAPEQFRERLLSAFGQTVGDDVWAMIRQGRLLDTVRHERRLATAAWLEAVRRRPAGTLIAGLKYVYLELSRRVRRKPATLLAVVGPDGVGKTTFINLLQKELARILVKDTEDIQVKHFRPHILPNIKQLLSSKQYDPSVEEFSKPHRAAPASATSSLGRLAYYWADYVLGYWLVIRRKCIAGTAIIFDRYFYDFVVDPRRSRLNLPAWVRKFFLRLTPQPDLVFFLDCDADTVYARKQELPRNEIERQLNEYRKLAAAFPARFVRLDACQAPEMSCRQALRELVTRSFTRA